MTWTTEQIELLKAHYDAGLSCAQIAREIGMTRNAVIGKLNRLGLSRFKNALASQGDRRAAVKLRGAKAAQHKLAAAFRAEPREPLEQAFVAGERRCSFVDLAAAKCRWPIGEPGSAGFGFCGNDQLKGFSYCAAHTRMAYRRSA